VSAPSNRRKRISLFPALCSLLPALPLLFHRKEQYHQASLFLHTPEAGGYRACGAVAVLPDLGVNMVRSRSQRQAASLRNFVGIHLSAVTIFVGMLASPRSRAQEIILNVTYVCNGEHIYVYGCNIRDESDSGWCSIGHPDKKKDGMDTYTSTTRGDLKKLLPTCQQPSPEQIAKHKEFEQKLQARRDADEKRANDQMRAANNAPFPGQRQMTPEQRKINRCVTSGRLQATCTGNALVRGFDELTGHVMSTIAPDLPPGPELSGAFGGAGNWVIDFGDRGASMKCSMLEASPYNYTLTFRDNRPVVTLNTAPKPTVLMVRGDQLSGPGPLTIDGRVIVGWTKGSGGGSAGTAGHYETQQVTTHQELTPLEATQYAGQDGLSRNGQTYDMASTSSQTSWVPGTTHAMPSGPQPIYGPKRAICVAPELKNTGPGSTVAATGMLKTLFSNGDSGPPIPPGVRMHGIFAASTGFSVEFFPESAVLGCGPDAARAYPYTVIADGTRTAIRIDAPDHPLLLAIHPDGSLDPGGSGPYQVHGRAILGNNGDNFTFAPFEMTCSLAVLAPSKTIPESGGQSTALLHASVPSAPVHTTGNSTLTISSGLPVQPGAPNPLALHPYILLRSSFDDVVHQSGVTVPAGTMPLVYFGQSCASGTPDCQAILAAIKANLVADAKADANGSATLPNLAAGTYYFMVSTRLANNHALIWTQPVQVKDGPNSVTLDIYNATRVN